MALLTSLKIVPVAILIAFIISLILAWISSSKSKLISIIIELLVTIPVFIPPTVLGFYLMQIMGKNSLPGKLYIIIFGESFIFSRTAAVTAAALAGIPFIYKSIKTFLDSVDTSFISAAEISGASRLQIFIYILLPLSRNGILGGLLLGFLRGLGEFGITMMIAGNIEGVTKTIPLAIWESVVSGKTDTAHYYSVLLAVVSIFIIIIFKLLEKNH